jgi:hypothetical protein
VNFSTVAALALIGTCAVAEPARSAPISTAIQAAAAVALEGTVEVLIEDSPPTSRTRYFLVSGDRRIPLRFRRRPLNLATGARVRVRGRWEKDTLVVTALERL